MRVYSPLTTADLFSEKDRANRSFAELAREYESFDSHYRELSEFVDPRRGRFFLQDRNKGTKRHKNIYNNHATVALRKATAGMLAGSMSPAQPWFTFDLFDKEVLHDPEVAQWLTLLQTVLFAVFRESNFYQMAPVTIRELLLFGTGALMHEDDFEDVARFYNISAGSYFIGQNSKMQVNRIAREYQLTTLQMVARFGRNNVSQPVKDAYDRSNYGNWFTVRHLIELNPFRDGDEERFDASRAKFSSLYWEPGTERGPGADRGKFLRRSGYKGFPVYVPRWELVNEDVYGVNCPGMTALGDVKALQKLEREKAKAIEKHNTPPLQGPPSMANQPIRNLPGGFTIVTSNSAKVEKLYDVDPRIQEMLMDVKEHERRIDAAWFVDMFMAITDMEGVQPKNQMELAQRDSERLLQIGPALQQVHGEWLGRMVSRTTQQVLDAKILPPAPEKLQGRELEVQFTSPLAVAQQQIGLKGMEATLFFAGTLQEQGLEIGDRIDGDYALDEYARLNGAPPKLLRSVDDVTEAREKKKGMMEMQQGMDMVGGGAGVAKMLGDAKMGEGNALDSVVGAAGGE